MALKRELHPLTARGGGTEGGLIDGDGAFAHFLQGGLFLILAGGGGRLKVRAQVGLGERMTVGFKCCTVIGGRGPHPQGGGLPLLKQQVHTLLSAPGGGVFLSFSVAIKMGSDGIASNSLSDQKGTQCSAAPPEPSSSTTTESAAQDVKERV